MPVTGWWLWLASARLTWELIVTSSGIVCGCLGTLAQISHPVSLTIYGIMLLLSLVLITQKGKEFLTLGWVFDRINPGLRAKRRRCFNVSLVASVVLFMVVVAGIIFAVVK